MTTLPDFEREMKAEARKTPNLFVRERFLVSALAAKALADPTISEEHKTRLVAGLRNLAEGIAAHRQETESAK